MSFSFLIVDGYDRAARDRLQTAGCNTGGEHYARMLLRPAPDARHRIVYPADGDDFLPQSAELTDFDSLL